MSIDLKVGDAFPTGITFNFIPPASEEDPTTCNRPEAVDASNEWASKKIVLVAVPGAFTPTCQGTHLSGFIAKIGELKAKGVDQVVIIAFNDAWVMDGWRMANGIKNTDIVFMEDPGLAFCKKIGRVKPNGLRAARFAMVIDNGKVTYIGQDDTGVAASGADAVLTNL